MSVLRIRRVASKAYDAATGALERTCGRDVDAMDCISFHFCDCNCWEKTKTKHNHSNRCTFPIFKRLHNFLIHAEHRLVMRDLAA